MHDTLFVYSCVESAKLSIFGFCSPGTGAAPMVALPCLAASSGKILRDCLVWKEQGLGFSLQELQDAPSRILPMNSYCSYWMHLRLDCDTICKEFAIKTFPLRGW
jgi:hypothetical protein